MWPLLLLSVLTLAVILERVVFLLRERASRSKAAVDKIFDFAREGNIEAAVVHAQASRDVVARVLGAGLEHVEHCFEESISCQAETELNRYEVGASLLDTAVTLAPLLGLLGTVTGMIRSFGLLGAAELDAPVAITGGIAEALIATAFGLMIAIVALVPLNLLTTAKERLTREIEDAASRLEILLKSPVRRGNRSQSARAA